MEALGFEWASAAAGPAPEAGDAAASGGAAGRSYRCPACGFRWRLDDGGEVVPL